MTRAAIMLSMLSACGGPSLERSEACPAGRVDVWCEDEQCEARVLDVTLACEGRGADECANAEAEAHAICRDATRECGRDSDCHLVDSPARDVDLLVAVDTTGSMGSRQIRLAEALPRLIRALVSGDHDEDGVSDAKPARSVQVGFVSLDMGTGGHLVPGCSPDFGDDGVLADRGVPRAGCEETYPRFLRFGPEDELEGEALQCIAHQGFDGCGIQQPLEATLKALTPSTSSLRFVEESRGHADGPNAGFQRPGALLATLIATYEDDCSVADPRLFDTSPAAPYPGELGLRCAEYADPEAGALATIDRFVQGLVATRDDPSELVFTALVGIPIDAERFVVGPVAYDRLLRHELMVNEVDPRTSTSLRPSCDRIRPGTMEREMAWPPRRIVEAAQALEAHGAGVALESLCGDDIELHRIARAISDGLGQACLPRALARDEDGRVDCVLTERLPAGERCAAHEGRVLLAVEDDRERCLVRQRAVVDGAPALGPGWAYVTRDEEGAVGACGAREQRVLHSPAPGAVVQLRCGR